MRVKDYNPLSNTGILKSTLAYINKRINRQDGEKTLPGTKMPNNKSKSMMGLEIHHWTTITVIIHSSKKHQ